MRILKILVLAITFLGFSFAEGPKPWRATSTVEKVFRTEDEGYISISYLVTWMNQPTIVIDSIHQTDFKVGEKVTFLVLKNALESKPGTPEKKLLHFEVIPPHIL
jgi:hypothetical protein